MNIIQELKRPFVFGVGSISLFVWALLEIDNE